ncbi:MAG: hypothetical protein J3Q66DRAFT_359929 [Benniella sp.]|nr:MAG: hypothetical protein J3Q66DRAFT_359929 [Benniella sp.]
MSSSQINLTKSCTSNGKSPGCVRGFVRERCHKCHLGSIACEMCHPYPAPAPAESGLAATSTPSTLSFGSSIPWKRPRKTISFTPRRSLTIESSAAVAAAVAEAGVAAPPTPKRKPSPSTPTSISFALNNNSNTNTTTSSAVSSALVSSSLSASPPASPSYPNYSAPSSPSLPPTPASSCMFCKSGRKACEECFGLGYVQRVCQDCLRESHYLHRNKRQRRASSTGHNPSRRGSCTTTTTTATTTPPARRKASLPVLSFGSQIETWNQMGVQMEEGWTKFKEQSKSQMEGGWSKFKEQVIAPLTTVARAGSTTTTTTTAAAGGTGIGAAAAAATAAEGATTANESLSAGQEPTLEREPQVPEQLCEDDQEPISAMMATTTTTTPSPHASVATFSNQESGIDMILPCPSTPPPHPHCREGSDQKASADGNIMAAVDQQVNSNNNNKSNDRLSFKAAVKKHLKVRPLFTLHHLKSSKTKNTNATTTTTTTITTIHDNSSIPTGKETRNSKRRRRHWPFPSLLSSSLHRTASSAA